MFGFKTRKARHFELFTAIYAQMTIVDESEPDIDDPRSRTERVRDAWEDAAYALRRWEYLNAHSPRPELIP